MKDIERFNLSRSEWERLIDEWIIGRNSERDRAIIKRKLLDGATFLSISEEFEMSFQQVQTIVYKCENRLLKVVK